MSDDLDAAIAGLQMMLEDYSEASIYDDYPKILRDSIASITALRAQLAASPPADPVTNAGCRQQVKVKPLKWRRDNLKGSYPARFRAEMPCKSGDYTLAGSERENLWQWFRNGYFAVGHQMHKPMPLEDAKAAAQADYEARILSALEAAHHVSETPKSEHDNVNVLTAEARRVLVEATKAIENLPRRQEKISGQTFSYVQLAEAVTAIRAIKEDEA